MSQDNLPPGVNVSDIPGNRPEDAIYEEWLDGRIGDTLYDLAHALATATFDVEEAIYSELRKVLAQARTP